ncbi:MAG: ATP-binding protein [Spirochaetes bacterium]|nr:ATP-binding protein [Spirochaetota bacterium]
MDIVITSGKGGTGKTMLSAAIASLMGDAGSAVCLMDCDVEAPNAALLLKIPVKPVDAATVPVPSVDTERCTGCGACEKICRYNAIPVIQGQPLVLPELCHGCGGCALACPEKAIHEVPREIGAIEEGERGTLHFVGGRLNIGEAMSPPLIREVKRRYYGSDTRIIDSPPGTSCPAVTAADGARYAVLVAEPTPFGLNDFILASQMLRALEIPLGAVINRDGCGDGGVDHYCLGQGIEVIAKIPQSWEIAAAYSRGEAVEHLLEHHRDALDTIAETALRGAARCS